VQEEFEDTKGVESVYIEEQKTQRPKRTNNRQRSTKHTHKTKDRVTRTPLKTGGEHGSSGRVSSSCSNPNQNGNYG